MQSEFEGRRLLQLILAALTEIWSSRTMGQPLTICPFIEFFMLASNINKLCKICSLQKSGLFIVGLSNRNYQYL